MIKKYKNRKYYSTNLAKYVNLKDIIDLYKIDNSLQVVDYLGNDITKSTLQSAVYEVELIQGITQEELERRIGGLK